MLITPYVVLGIVFATIGVFVVLLGLDALRRGTIGDHRKLIFCGLSLTFLGIVLGII